jgi:uncharacterized membrane protein YfcA
MEQLLIGVAALFAAGLTFFSGFGLGTVLLPAFVLFMPTSAAIAGVAIVHFLNNLLKLGLVRKHVDRRALVLFGLPAFGAAFLGAVALDALDGLDPLGRTSVGSLDLVFTPANVVIAGLLVVLGLQELLYAPERGALSDRFLPVGGVLSGFIGGLSGLQGALRSAFLVRTGMSAAPFIATGAAIALLVDGSRIAVYTVRGLLFAPGQDASTIAAALVGAAAGTLLGNRFIEKVTLRAIQIIVGVLLLLVAVALGLGLL